MAVKTLVLNGKARGEERMGTNMEGIRLSEGNEDELIEEEDTVCMKIKSEESNEDKNNYENLQMWGEKRKSRIMMKV